MTGRSRGGAAHAAPVGTDELLGHLPVYGAMLVLLVYGSHPQLRPAVSALWPFATPSRARPRAALQATASP